MYKSQYSFKINMLFACHAQKLCQNIHSFIKFGKNTIFWVM